MNDGIKVSVIVPVYNSEKYLVNCLSYLVNQTLQEIEIITVDDCSTDSSRDILMECKRQFPDKVKVIFNEENRGPGGARNAGIAAAQGEYIGFVDNDDQVSPDMYRLLYEKARDTGADIVDAAFVGSEEKKPCIATPDALCGTLDIDKKRSMMCAKGYLWSKIYRRSLFTDNDIRLLENSPFDDSSFLTYIYAYASSIATVKQVLYIHREHKASYSHNLPLKTLTQKWYTCMEDMAEKLQNTGNFEAYREVFEYRVFDYYTKLLNAYLVDENFRENTYPAELGRFADKYLTDTVNNKYIQKYVPEHLRVLGEKNKSPEKIIKLKKH